LGLRPFVFDIVDTHVALTWTKLPSRLGAKIGMVL